MLTAGCGARSLCVLRNCDMFARQGVAHPRRSLLVTTAAAVEADGGEASISPSAVNVALHSMRIRDALRGGRRPVACQGVVQLSSPVSVYGRKRGGEPFAVQLPPANTEALAPLLDACVPAVFGRGSEEVLDDSYRRALALPTDRFSTTFDLSAHSILWDVRSLLRPDAHSIRAHLHKLNVYGPGGFFKTHQDTPRSSFQFGSLVVCLPAPHEGGDLVIRHDGSEKARTSWGSRKDSTHFNCKARWAAFYSDCEHEVEPVTEGYRITLTYDLFVDSKAWSAMPPTPTVDASAIDSIPVHAALQAALSDPTFLPSGGTLGLACSHTYYRSDEFRSLAEHMLKGSDALAFAVASRLHMQPRLKYVFDEEARDKEARNYGFEIDDEDADEYGFEPLPTTGYQLTSTSITFYSPVHHEGDTRDLLFDMDATTAEHILWLNEADLRFCTTHVVTLWGNQQAPPSVMYSAAAILMTVPAIDSNGQRESPWGY